MLLELNLLFVIAFAIGIAINIYMDIDFTIGATIIISDTITVRISNDTATTAISDDTSRNTDVYCYNLINFALYVARFNFTITQFSFFS